MRLSSLLVHLYRPVVTVPRVGCLLLDAPLCRPRTSGYVISLHRAYHSRIGWIEVDLTHSLAGFHLVRVPVVISSRLWPHVGFYPPRSLGSMPTVCREFRILPDSSRGVGEVQNRRPSKSLGIWHRGWGSCPGPPSIYPRRLVVVWHKNDPWWIHADVVWEDDFPLNGAWCGPGWSIQRPCTQLMWGWQACSFLAGFYCLSCISEIPVLSSILWGVSLCWGIVCICCTEVLIFLYTVLWVLLGLRHLVR